MESQTDVRPVLWLYSPEIQKGHFLSSQRAVIDIDVKLLNTISHFTELQ